MIASAAAYRVPERNLSPDMPAKLTSVRHGWSDPERPQRQPAGRSQPVVTPQGRRRSAERPKALLHPPRQELQCGLRSRVGGLPQATLTTSDAV